MEPRSSSNGQLRTTRFTWVCAFSLQDNRSFPPRPRLSRPNNSDELTFGDTHMRLWLLVIGLWLALAPGCAAQEWVSALLRSMTDGGPLPSEKVFYDTVNEDDFNRLSADTVREFLPLARTLLKDSRPEARRY